MQHSKKHKRKISVALTKFRNTVRGKKQQREKSRKFWDNLSVQERRLVGFGSNFNSFKRKRNGNWRGGITPLNHLIRNCNFYYEWRKKIKQRDRGVCQGCFKMRKENEIHHIKQFFIIREENNIKTLQDALKCKELWDVNNGATLCKKCHYLTRHGYKK